MTQLTIEQAFQIAIQHHQAGQLSQAEAIYRQILTQHPNQPDALHLLGVIAQQVGRHDVAVDLIQRAVALNPNFSEAHNNLGISLRGNGQLDAAITAFRQAIALNPKYSEAYYHLGIALQDKEQLDDAIIAYRQAIAHKPHYPEAHYNLGIVLQAKGQLDEAINFYRQAIALKPDYSEAHSNLGVVLAKAGQFDEAVAACRQALTVNPNYPEAHSNLGNVLRDKGQLDEAITAFRQAIALNPNYADAYYNLGNTLKEKGQPDEAIAAYRAAITLQPDFAGAHNNLALTLLAQGNFLRGWEEYEWRSKCKEYRAIERNFSQPFWDGRPLAGATLLLHAEQGFGDAIQFVRYLPLVIQQGGRIILECQAELKPLLKPLAAGCQLVVRGGPLPAFDFHCPLLSLPKVFATTLDSIPRQVPYLYAGIEAAEKWRQRLAGNANSIKVGLAWAGNKRHKNNRNRSMALSAFAPLARLHGVSFYSLQKGEQSAQARTPPADLKLIDRTEDLMDFADTAALIANLDLVISVDTSVVHLAGAMGKPVWVMLPFVSDWRWMLEREDSPWYPTMRLFRQSQIGDWENVVRRVSEAFEEFTASLLR